MKEEQQRGFDEAAKEDERIDIENDKKTLQRRANVLQKLILNETDTTKLNNYADEMATNKLSQMDLDTKINDKKAEL